MKVGFVYMMASQKNGTIYVGSTSNLIQRVVQHRGGAAEDLPGAWLQAACLV